MAGAGGAAGPVPDVRHQPPVTPLDKYYSNGINNNDAASTVVKAAWRYAQGRVRTPTPASFCSMHMKT